MGYTPAPGPQNPKKYDRVGPNYAKFGEQPGYIYYPPQDRYYTDPTYAKNYAKQQGYAPKEPKAPSLGGTIGPIAAAGGALALGSALGHDPGGFITGITDKLGSNSGGLFGLGSNAASASPVGATGMGPFANTGALAGAYQPSVIPDAIAPTAQIAQTAMAAPSAELASLGPTALPDTIGINGPTLAAPDISNIGAQFGGTGAAANGTVPANAPGLFGIGSTASNVLGAAGVGLGAYNAFQGIKNKNPFQAGLGGGGVGLGLSALGYSLGPVGWTAALGAPALLSLASKAFDQPSTGEIQAGRWKATGHANPNAKGFDYFAGTGGEQSRDESFLTPDAIRNNPDNYNNIPDWDSWSKPSQDQFLSQMLSEGKVSERKGGIYYDDARAKELADQIRKQSTPGAPKQTNAAPPVVQPTRQPQPPQSPGFMTLAGGGVRKPVFT